MNRHSKYVEKTKKELMICKIKKPIYKGLAFIFPPMGKLVESNHAQIVTRESPLKDRRAMDNANSVGDKKFYYKSEEEQADIVLEESMILEKHEKDMKIYSFLTTVFPFSLNFEEKFVNSSEEVAKHTLSLKDEEAKLDEVITNKSCEIIKND